MVANPDISSHPVCAPCAVMTYTRTMPDPHYRTRKELFWTVYNQIQSALHRAEDNPHVPQSSSISSTSLRLTPEQLSSLSEGTELAQFQGTLHDYRLIETINRLPTRRHPTSSEISTAHALRVSMVYDARDNSPTLVITW